jgi:MFS family permease
VPIAVLAGGLRMEQLYIVAFLAGVLSVFRDVAGTAYLHSLVGRERLVEANALMTASSSAAGMGGPGLAGSSRRQGHHSPWRWTRPHSSLRRLASR